MSSREDLLTYLKHYSTTFPHRGPYVVLVNYKKVHLDKEERVSQILFYESGVFELEIKSSSYTNINNSNAIHTLFTDADEAARAIAAYRNRLIQAVYPYSTSVDLYNLESEVINIYNWNPDKPIGLIEPKRAIKLL